MEGLTTVLNGIKYLLIEYLVTDSTKIHEVKELVKKYDGIYQGVGKVGEVGGFFSSKRYAVIKILIPEKNVIAFNNESN